jgi:hypothetical protein
MQFLNWEKAMKYSSVTRTVSGVLICLLFAVLLSACNGQGQNAECVNSPNCNINQSQNGGSGNGQNNPASSPQSNQPDQGTTSLPTSTPTPNPCASKPGAGTILYQSDWSQDTNGWVGPGDWAATNGMLVNNGNGNPPIFAPYHPGDNCVSDYAVEAKITAIRYNSDRQASFGLVVRATDNGGGYTFSICAEIKYAFGATVGSCANNNDGSDEYDALLLVGQQFPDGGTVPGKVGFKPHFNIGHIYRIEVQGDQISAFIDGNRIIGPVTDNSTLSGGQVGIWSTDCQINVNSFKVMAL